MGKPVERWPTYAKENAEDSIYRLKQLEKLAAQIQDAIVLGDAPVALRDLSEVRVLALQCVDNLVRAQLGKYQQQERQPQWSRPEATQEAVAKVVATRRS